jgi:hypothetical protein
MRHGVCGSVSRLDWQSDLHGMVELVVIGVCGSHGCYVKFSLPVYGEVSHSLICHMLHVNVEMALSRSHEHSEGSHLTH